MKRAKLRNNLSSYNVPVNLLNDLNSCMIAYVL
jgi:hypothetical protein